MCDLLAAYCCLYDEYIEEEEDVEMYMDLENKPGVLYIRRDNKNNFNVRLIKKYNREHIFDFVKLLK